MTPAQLDMWAQHMGDAAAAVAMAEAFRHDRTTRRHWLDCADRSMTAAHAIREAARDPVPFLASYAA